MEQINLRKTQISSRKYYECKKYDVGFWDVDY